VQFEVLGSARGCGVVEGGDLLHAVIYRTDCLHYKVANLALALEQIVAGLFHSKHGSKLGVDRA
jgi:hypothetical protein